METLVQTVKDLNAAIRANRFDVFVREMEARQDADLLDIADTLVARTPTVRLVLLAGPSSAGKTTTAHLLCAQLQAKGLSTLRLSTDDYFVGDARNPRDAQGNLDYEHVDAVDAPRLAADINALFAGQAVHLRKFNFLRHDGFDAPTETRLASKGVIVLEGIHALNPKLTSAVADDVKFRVYLNAMTHLKLDLKTRISATDTRLVRRLVRDFHYRGMAPQDTFRLWPSVLAGEHRWIDPFRDVVDVVFNSALDYELAVLKPFAEELLARVTPSDAAFPEATRLQALLAQVETASAEAVPGDSILRETIGGSQLEY